METRKCSPLGERGDVFSGATTEDRQRAVTFAGAIAARFLPGEWVRRVRLAGGSAGRNLTQPDTIKKARLVASPGVSLTRVEV